MAKKINYTYASGKRKSASCRVRLFKGKGQSTINSLPLEKVLLREVDKIILSKPFGLTETTDKYYFSARIIGGGKTSQLDALILALTKALVKVNPKFRMVLKKAGLLTRDARERQRRMVGTGGKSRRAKQSPKR
jgi:small subunit ribosomal protein S9